MKSPAKMTTGNPSAEKCAKLGRDQPGKCGKTHDHKQDKDDPTQAGQTDYFSP